jgi:DNA-binding transcriptional regulator YiaG
MTIIKWEGNATVPEIRYMPAIVQFLGYNPEPPASSLPECLVAARRALGLSQRKMAESMGVDPSSLLGWETGRHQPTERSLGLIGRVLQSR